MIFGKDFWKVLTFIIRLLHLVGSIFGNDDDKKDLPVIEYKDGVMTLNTNHQKKTPSAPK